MESTSESDNAQAIAPSIRRHFGPVARRITYTKGDVKALSKYKVTRDSAVDAALSQQLAESIKTVSKRVNVVNASFEGVRQIVHNPLLNQDICHSTELVSEWDELEENFNDSLRNSSRVAKGAGALIRDFLLVVMPYLKDDSDIKAKQKELGDYREELDRGGELAFNFVSDFKKVSRRVQGFKRHWGDHCADVLDELAKDIQMLEESLARTNSLLMQKAQLKTLKKTIKAQSDSEEKVTKHTDVIHDGTADLIAVWNFIYDDVNTIVSQLRLAEKGDSQTLFRQRLAALDVQYRDLWNNLQTYSSATDPSSAVKSSFFSRLFRIKM